VVHYQGQVLAVLPHDCPTTLTIAIDKISYLPGNLANGSVSYNACFHDLPDGLQTHVYAPLGLDIKAKWSVGGSMPGEPKQPTEMGLAIPKDGLYLREDVKLKCNIMMISFVKKTFKDAHSKLVDRLVEKTHLLEAKAANDKLKSPDLHNANFPQPSIASGIPMFHPGSPGYQHLCMIPKSSSSAAGSPMMSPQPQMYVPPKLSLYGQGDSGYQAANLYANDPRYSQYQHPDRQKMYDHKPLHDPKHSRYPDPRTDPQYPLPPGLEGDYRMSMHPADQKVGGAPNYYSPHTAQTQFAPVELPTSHDGKGRESEPVELA
jgi:hypothetical protein